MYQALYRSWRPTTFADMVGQEHITRTLTRQIEAGRLSHAYLLTGTRGTGKTSCAKVLAKAVNCENPQEGNPCNQCTSCVGITDGSVLDVLELDAASNNGVDQVRALRDEAVYTPSSVKKRVYIIDEVHMLSAPAFNALLKILEEPPSHVLFILATTELHKISPTIRSRCQHFSFRRILPQDISARLHYVCKQEQIPITQEGADLLARLANGGLRDALSLLDQCRDSECVDPSHILSVLGLAGNADTAQLAEHIVGKDSDAALLQMSQLYENGRDISSILEELSMLFRDLLLQKTAPKHGDSLLLGGYDNQTLQNLGEKTAPPQLLYYLQILQETLASLSSSKNRRTEGELCLLRLSEPALDTSFTALSARMSQLEEQVKQGIVSGSFKVAAQAPQTMVQGIEAVPSVPTPPVMQMQRDVVASTPPVVPVIPPQQTVVTEPLSPKVSQEVTEENAWFMMEEPDWMGQEGYDSDVNDQSWSKIPSSTAQSTPPVVPVAPVGQPQPTPPVVPVTPVGQPQPIPPVVPVAPVGQPQPIPPVAPVAPVGQPQPIPPVVPVASVGQPQPIPPVEPVQARTATKSGVSLEGCDQGAVWQGFLATYATQLPSWAKPYLKNPIKVRGFYGGGRMILNMDNPFTEKTLKKDNLPEKLGQLLSQYAGSPVEVFMQVNREGSVPPVVAPPVMATEVPPVVPVAPPVMATEVPPVVPVAPPVVATEVPPVVPVAPPVMATEVPPVVPETPVTATEDAPPWETSSEENEPSNGAEEEDPLDDLLSLQEQFNS